MMRKGRALWIMLFVLLSVSKLCPAAVSPSHRQQAQEYFDKATNKYLAGDMSSAVSYLEKVIELDPEHQQARTLLSIVLGETASSYFIQGDYARALPYLEKLRKIFPDDPEIQRMYDQASKGVATAQRSEDMVKFLQKQQHTLVSQRPPALEKVRPSSRKKSKAVKEAKPVQPPPAPVQVIAVQVPPVQVSTVSSRVDEEVSRRLAALKAEMDRRHEEAMSHAQAQISREKHDLIRNVLLWSGGFTALVSSLFAFFAFFLHRQSVKERQNLSEGVEKIIEHFRNVSRSPELAKLPQEPGSMSPSREISHASSGQAAEPQLEVPAIGEPAFHKEDSFHERSFHERSFQENPREGSPADADSSVQEPLSGYDVYPDVAVSGEDAERAAKIYGKCCDRVKEIYEMVNNWDLSFSRSAIRLVNELIINLKDNSEPLVRIAMAPYGDIKNYLFAHCVNVSILSCYLKLDESQDKLREIGLAGMLHDVGVAEKMNLVHEPRRIEEHEREILRLLKKSGAWILKNLDSDKEDQKSIHERISSVVQARHDLIIFLDFYGTQKPLLPAPGDSPGTDHQFATTHPEAPVQEIALLIGFVEVFEALTHDRPYREAFSPAEAVRVMEKNIRNNPTMEKYLRTLSQKLNISRQELPLA